MEYLHKDDMFRTCSNLDSPRTRWGTAGMQHGMGVGARTGGIWHPGGFRCGTRSMGVGDSMLVSFELPLATTYDAGTVIG